NVRRGSPSQPPDKLLRLFKFGEELFFRMKGGGMHAASAAVQLYRVPQMEHLVVDDILDRVAGNLGMIEDPADDDRIVSRVVVSQKIACAALAPTHLGPRLHAAKEPQVQTLEDGVQVVKKTAC